MSEPDVAPAAVPDALLDRPAGESARRLALRQVERARAARRALAAADDPEALHDLRVALRRLRSLLRAFAAELRAPVGRKLRRRLRQLAAATNPGRDAEVGHAAVASWLAEPPPAAERRAASALAARLAAQRDGEYERFDARFLTRLDAALDRLAERLAVWEIDLRPEGAEPPPSFRALLAAELAKHREALAAAFTGAGEGDADAVHAARLEAKRLRYLLESAGDERPAAAVAVRRLRRLQDLLGEANDLAVLAGELATLAAECEAARTRHDAGLTPRPAAAPGGRAGRLALARRIARERAARLAEAERDWMAPRGAERLALERELAAAAAALGD